jgi:hypothetical protein
MNNSKEKMPPSSKVSPNHLYSRNKCSELRAEYLVSEFQASSPNLHYMNKHSLFIPNILERVSCNHNVILAQSSVSS